MIEPLCLNELDRLLNANEPLPTLPTQGDLFPTPD